MSKKKKNPQFFDPVSQDVCHTRGHREQRIIARCVLNYSCHRAPIYAGIDPSGKIWNESGLWFVDPGGQGGFNIGVIERGICRFSPAALFTLAFR